MDSRYGLETEVRTSYGNDLAAQNEALDKMLKVCLSNIIKLDLV